MRQENAHHANDDLVGPALAGAPAAAASGFVLTATLGHAGVSQTTSLLEVELEEPHAAARWARAIVPLIGAPRDPRTIAAWGRHVAASPGALRNWCRTAGIQARRSLLFGRLLRAAHVSQRRRQKPANLLDIVDNRTMKAVMRAAGFWGTDDFPNDVGEFLERQRLVSDPDLLQEVNRALSR